MNEMIRLTSFSKRKTKLIIENNSIEFGNQNLNLGDVHEFKYGAEPIRLDMFSIGRKLKLDLRTPINQIQIVFKSYFGFFSDDFHKNFSQILNEIWEVTGNRLINKAIDKITVGETVHIGNCAVTNEGVFFLKVFYNLGQPDLSKELQQINFK